MKGIVVSSDSNRATQYKILKDAIPIFCAEKGYNGVGGIVHEMKDWVEVDFYPDPPSDAKRRKFSKPYRTVLCQETVTTIEPREVPRLSDDGNPLVDSISGDAIMVFEN